MFGLGFSEIVLILLVGLLVLGPKQLPKAAQKLGKTLAEFRRATEEIRREFTLPDFHSPLPPEVPTSTKPSLRVAPSNTLETPQETSTESTEKKLGNVQ